MSLASSADGSIGAGGGAGGDGVPKSLSNLTEQKVYSIKVTRTASTKEVVEPRLTVKAQQTRRKVNKANKGKANSLDTTPPDPDATALVMVHCLSKAVFSVVKLHDSDRGTQIDSFMEECNGCPSYETVHQFFQKIFTSKNLSAECAVTAAAYVDRLEIVSNVKINQSNWRRVGFVSVLEADKVLRDKLVWNEDYKDLLPGIDLFELRKLERNFLKYIEFNLTLSQSDYARYYFDLLSLKDSSEFLSAEATPPAPPQPHSRETWLVPLKQLNGKEEQDS